MALRTLFSWIHLSDIHFGYGTTGDGYDLKSVLTRLVHDLDAARQEGAPEKPDAILVTGDIAFSGAGRDPREYDEARTWLLDIAARVGLGPQDVFVVPGNHDVDRGKDSDTNTAALMTKLRDGTMEVDTALAHDVLRATLADRMGAYLRFASGFAPACAGGGKGEVFWVHRAERNGLKVRLAGLDTSLLCSRDDKEKLRLGKQQIHEALAAPAGKDELIVVMTHHPLRPWLGEADARIAEQWIYGGAHVHLCGHVHEAGSRVTRGGSGTGGAVRVVAGAVHNERQPEIWIPAGHGYNWGAVVDDGSPQLKLRLWPRRWSDGNIEFRLDGDSVPRGKSYAELELSVDRTAAPAPVVTPEPAVAPKVEEPKPVAVKAEPPKPVEVFYFYAPEDEDLRKKLHTHLTLLRRGSVISTFDKRDVTLGSGAGDGIDPHLRTARIFLAMLSPDFIASDYFEGPEWTLANDRVLRNEATMVPVYLRPFDRDDPLWKNHALFGVKRAFPDREGYDGFKGGWVADGNPDTMFTALAKMLRQVINDLPRG